MTYPFSAIVGHDDLRLALLLNAVHPAIGGVLVRGEKGTAKSTIVRGLAALLPDVAVVEGCRFSCDPRAPDPDCPDAPHDHVAATRKARLVELPVGATEDRLVGSLDLERALTGGVRSYQPGLLCAAHRGVLYVDEVNLLHDHLVDLLLDAAAMGRAYVEREGVSVSHAASFLLVGTMNPEEGELRPQLLDRFGLTVEVRADRDVDARAEVIRRRLAFESDPAAFAARWSTSDSALAGRIAAARAALPGVRLPDPELRRIAALCAAFEVDGMRADLVVARTATAHAAWRGADAVDESDVEVAARLALPHRRRRDPFDEPGIDEEQLQQALREAAERTDGRPPDDEPDGPGPGGEPAPQSAVDGDGSAPARASTPDRPFRARLLELNGLDDGTPGRRSRARTTFGRTLRAAPAEGHGIHLVGTLTAAAPHQLARGRSAPG
jgi:magnesium chelatase subunit D